MDVERPKKAGTKAVMHCKACDEPTTHKSVKNASTAELEWSCLMCESAKFRTPEELERIKAKRKGWKNSFQSK